MSGIETLPDALIAAILFAIDPIGTGGIVLRTGPGIERDRYMQRLRAMLPAEQPFRRMPLHIAEARLLGGLDLAATLQAGRPIAERGLLAESDGGTLVLAMAERIAPETVAHLAASLDQGVVTLERDGFHLTLPARFGVVALDEGIEDEAVSPVLLDRLAFAITLGADSAALPDGATIELARARIGQISVGAEIIEALCGTALALGIDSIRPSLMALNAARALAAFAGEPIVRKEDAALAARLVLAPRATRLPQSQPEETEPQDAPPPEAGQDQSDAQPTEQDQPLDDVVLAAAEAAIPAGLLARLRLSAADRARGEAAGKAGAIRASKIGGRPAGIRRGPARAGQRLNVIETLRAAAPWQRLRRTPDRPDRVCVRPDDFRITQLKRRAETTTIFVVDASGSSALHRLGEAKGAVELLLGECYVRRDQVALIAFRGKEAALVLPATRSLVRAKRSLAAVPGGGGTPLATGIDAAAAAADAVRRQGRTPVIVLMTDGRANIDRSGKAGRPQATADAQSAATALRLMGITALLVDTAQTPQEPAARIAAAMGALYLPLPYADAAGLSRSIRAATR
jgi:magnesium chelatase subunit D